jgi:8-oxo-dGTP pyrophosphatase MutT (NUDIX family)
MADRAVAAVAYRETGDGPEFLLVRTKRGPWWTFPKGHVEDDDASPGAAALREAREEAGVVGTLVSPKPFTRYRYVKRRSGTEQDVDAYLVKVTRTTRPGEPERAPAWCSPAAARTRFAAGHNAAEHRRVLAAAMRRLATARRKPA